MAANVCNSDRSLESGSNPDSGSSYPLSLAVARKQPALSCPGWLRSGSQKLASLVAPMPPVHSKHATAVARRAPKEYLARPSARRSGAPAPSVVPAARNNICAVPLKKRKQPDTPRPTSATEKNEKAEPADQPPTPKQAAPPPDFQNKVEPPAKPPTETM